MRFRMANERLARDYSSQMVSGAASPLLQGRKLPPSLDAAPEKVLSVGRNEGMMFTGKLIENLMETVERTEKRFLAQCSAEEKLAHFYAISQLELAQFEPRLAGVA
jgi:hypothetical protein